MFNKVALVVLILLASFTTNAQYKRDTVKSISPTGTFHKVLKEQGGWQFVEYIQAPRIRYRYYGAANEGTFCIVRDTLWFWDSSLQDHKFALTLKDTPYIKTLAASGADGQNLYISNDTLSIERGNSVILPFVKLADSAAMLAPYLPKWLAAILYQPVLGFTPENVANKATNMNVLNNLLYPTTAAVNTWGNANYQPIGIYIRAMDTATMLANYLLKDHAAALYKGKGDSTTAGGFYPLFRADTSRYNMLAYIATKGSGTVTTVTVVTANGISGTVSNATTIPQISLFLNTIQDATGMAGKIVATAIADPATPAPNTGYLYMDATHHVFNIKNDAGVVSNTAIPNAGTSGQFFKTFGADGLFTLGTAVTSVTAGTGLSGGTITGTGTISMPNTGTAGTYGSSTQVAVITTDAQGRITSVTPTTITGFQVSGNYVTFSDTTISAAYTLTSRDLHRRIHCTNGSNIALTIPSGLGASFGCEVVQEGAGTVTPSGSGATIHFATSGDTKTGGQHSAISIQAEAATDHIFIQGKTQP